MIRRTIETRRLILRPFERSDAADVQRLAGEYAVADTTLNIPQPYEDGMAEDWIATHEPGFAAHRHVVFAISSAQQQELIGAISLILERRFDSGELGYWIGKPFWNQGFCTEAAIATLDYGFTVLGLNRIGAKFLARNPASGRVMEKAGMVLEGTARQAAKKWGKYEDLMLYGALREEWSPPHPQSSG